MAVLHKRELFLLLEMTKSASSYEKKRDNRKEKWDEKPRKSQNWVLDNRLELGYN